MVVSPTKPAATRKKITLQYYASAVRALKCGSQVPQVPQEHHLAVLRPDHQGPEALKLYALIAGRKRHQKPQEAKYLTLQFYALAAEALKC